MTYNAARDPNVGPELMRVCDYLGVTPDQARSVLFDMIVGKREERRRADAQRDTSPRG